jgi:hypothetical protein
VIVAVAGRRVDAPDSATQRFPLRNVGLVRDRLRELLRQHDARALVSSAACGADLIGQEVARDLRLRRIVVLPYPIDVFRERSVTDRPGDWGPLYDEIIAGLGRENGELVELNEPQDSDASQKAFMAANKAILERAERLVDETGEVEGMLAVILWDGASRGSDDLTDHFRSEALARGAKVAEVSTTD